MDGGPAKRVIPRLDIKGPNLVKGIHLEGLRILGPPEYFAKHYYETGADELLYMDAVASLYGRNSLSDIIRKTAEEMFVPLTVGGGLRTLEDIREVLLAGADRVAVNTAAIENPEFIDRAADYFGSSTIIVSIEAKRHADGRYTAFTDNGRDDSGREVVAWSQEAVARGAGEILVTSVDREGTSDGFDAELAAAVSRSVDVPVVVCGGASSPEDCLSVLSQADLSGVVIASILHYPLAQELVESGVNLGSGGEFKVIKDKVAHAPILGTTITAIKAALAAAGVECRQADE